MIKILKRSIWSALVFTFLSLKPCTGLGQGEMEYLDFQ